MKKRGRIVVGLYCGLLCAAACDEGVGSANGPSDGGSTALTPGGSTSGGGAGLPEGGADAGPGGSGSSAGGAQSGAAGAQNAGGAAQNMGGDAGAAGASAGGGSPTSLNYQLTGSWPERPVALQTQPGTLSYTKIMVHPRYLAESCTIGDYNNDGLPDLSSGRRWYEHTPAVDAGATPSFVEHIFREGHEEQATDGVYDTVTDDIADYAWDVDGDGWTDIINIANPQVDPDMNLAPEPQPHSTAYWYQNPGADLGDAPLWTPHLMHADVKHEQHSLFDVDGDGRPEITGACALGCSPSPQKRLGYYKQEDWTKPIIPWKYHAASAEVPFPYANRGFLHGLGAGDVNGDGKPDILERNGVWLQQADGSFAPDQCPGVGCIQTELYDGADVEYRGGAQMYAFDADGDDDQDIVSVDWAHGYGLAWYEQGPNMTFTKHYIVGTPTEPGIEGLMFTELHAVELVDMDGDDVRDIVTGKFHFSLQNMDGAPDQQGPAVLYVLRTTRDGSNTSGSVTFEPVLVDDASGVALQLATGHINTDGIPDICVATKLGLFAFLGH